MSNTKILGRVEFESEEEKNYYYEKAKELGCKSFKDFAITAMNEKIEAENYIVSRFNKAADLIYDVIASCQVQEEEEGNPLTPEDMQAFKVAKLAYDLLVNTDLMMDAKENQVFISSEMELDIGEKPYWRNKHALTDIDYDKYLKDIH